MSEDTELSVEAAYEEISWDRLDHTKFFVTGAGLFSGVTTALFPLSVIKTRQMTTHGVSSGLKGVRQTASTIWKTDGLRGFYRGYATVVFGTIPARVVYLTALEIVKTQMTRVAGSMDLPEATVAGVANFMAGASASLATQSVTVPIDVVSQRQMVHGADLSTSHSRAAPPAAAATSSAAAAASDAGSAASSSSSKPAGPAAAQPQTSSRSATSPASSSSASTSASQVRPPSRGGPGLRPGALNIVRMILREEGVRGLYRGFGPSVATFVPSSAIWWGSYGVYQKLLWSLLYADRPRQEGASGSLKHNTNEVVAVQTMSSMLAGCTSSLLTNPLDLIKTRIQVATKQEGQTVTFRSVAGDILREEGPRGLLRGVLPRMLNAGLWGSCMVSAYEFLKRNCQKEGL